MAKKLSFSIALNLLTDQFKRGAASTKASFRAMQMQVLSFAAALGVGGAGLFELVARFKDVARETSRVNTMLRNVSTSTRAFADNLEFINGMADKYGLEVNALTANFSRFTATASLANISMEEQKKIFESLSRASTAFGLSSDDSNAVFLALSQMMSKGKISSEELRGQMGERLPIAMQAMAKAAGVSMAGLEDLMKQGKLMSADVIPKFAAALNEMIPEVSTDNLETSLNRLSNSFTRVVDSSGFQQTYKALVDSLNTILQVAGSNIEKITTIIFAAIAFVITKAGSNIFMAWRATADKLISEAPQLNAQLTRATADRIKAEKALETSKLRHAQAVGAKRVKLAQQIAAQERAFLMAVAAENTALIKVQQAATAESAGLATRSFNAIRVGAAKLMVTLRSLWSSFAPALLISGLVAVGKALNDLYQKTNRVATLQKEYTANVAAESVQIDILFNRLKDATKGTDEYNSAKNAIISKYGTYLQGLSDEIKNLEDVEGAYKAISAAALQAAKDKAIAEGTEAATQDYVNIYKRQATTLKKSLEEAYGEVDGTRMFDNIIRQLSAGGGIDAEMQKQIDKLTKTSIVAYGTAGQAQKVETNVALSAVESIQRARVSLDKEIKQINSIFGSAAKDIDLTAVDSELKQKDIKGVAVEGGGFTPDPTVTPDVKKEIEGSIAWYKAKIKEVEETINASTDAIEITKLQKKIVEYNQAIDDLDGTTAANAIKTAEERRKKQEAIIAQTYADYKSYLQAQKELDEKYAKDRANMYEGGTLREGFTIENVTNLDREQKVASDALAVQFAEKQSEFEAFTDAIKNKTLEELEIALETAKSELDALQSTGLGDSDTLSAARARVVKLSEAVSKASVSDDVEVEGRALDSWVQLEEHLQNAANEFENIGDAIGGAAGDAIKFVGSLASSTISIISSIAQFGQKSSEAITATAVTSANAIKSVEKASVILAIISAALQIAMQIAEFINSNAQAEADNLQALEDMQTRRNAQQREYNALLREEAAARADEGTIFGGDDFGAATQSLNRYVASQRELNAAIKGNTDDYKALLGLAAAHTAAGYGEATGPLASAQKELDDYEKGIEGLNNIRVVIGTETVKTGFLNLKKEQRDITAGIADTYEDILDAEGKLNVELAESILQTEKLSDADKELLQSLIDLQTEANEALDAVNEYWSSIFGDLSSTLTDALVDAFKNGTDAGVAFADGMSAMLENLAADFAKSLAFDAALQAAQAKAEAITSDTSLTEAQRALKMQALLIETGAELSNAQNDFFKYLELMQEGAAAQGVEIFKPDEVQQEASTGGFETMDQDTGSELNGRFAALQMSGVKIEGILSTIDGAVKQLNAVSNINSTLLEKQNTILEQSRKIQQEIYYKIEANDKKITAITDYLDKIAKNTENL